MSLSNVSERSPLAPIRDLNAPQDFNQSIAAVMLALNGAGESSFWPATALGRIDSARWPGIDYLNNQITAAPQGSFGLPRAAMPESNSLERGLNDRIMIATARALETMTGLSVLPVRASGTEIEEYRNPAGMPEQRSARAYQLFVKGDQNDFRERFLEAGGNAALQEAVRRDVYRTDIGIGILDGLMNNIVLPLLQRVTGDRQHAY